MKIQKKGNAIAALVVGALFFAGAIICIIVWAVLDDYETGMLCLVLGGVLAFSGILMLVVGITQLNVAKKVAENMSNPSSLCYKTYGNGGNYTYFLAYPDRKGQNSRNTAVNVAGALSFIFLGAGVFSFGGAESCDVFISPEELVINNRKRNNKLMDAGFQRIPSGAVLSIQFQTDKNFQRVFITFAGGGNLLLDISLKTYSADLIRDTFLKLRESQVAMQEIKQTEAVSSEDIFEI